MISNTLIFSLLTFSYLALGCMALAIFSHFRDSFKQPPTQAQSRGLYWVGWSILIASYYLGISYLGFAYGSILFIGILSFAGLLVILTASYRPRHLPHLMAGSTSLGVSLMLIS